jgi:hypothetical protein
LLFDGALVAADGFLVVFFFLGLGHADEPVEGEGGDDVEDAVGPEDTFWMLAMSVMNKVRVLISPKFLHASA